MATPVRARDDGGAGAAPRRPAVVAGGAEGDGQRSVRNCIWLVAFRSFGIGPSGVVAEACGMLRDATLKFVIARLCRREAGGAGPATTRSMASNS